MCFQSGFLLLYICKDSRKLALAGLLFAYVLRIKMKYADVKLLLTYWSDWEIPKLSKTLRQCFYLL